MCAVFGCHFSSGFNTFVDTLVASPSTLLSPTFFYTRTHARAHTHRTPGSGRCANALRPSLFHLPWSAVRRLFQGRKRAHNDNNNSNPIIINQNSLFEGGGRAKPLSVPP